MKKLIFVVLLGVSFCRGADGLMLAKHSSFEEIPKIAKIVSLEGNKITDFPQELDLPNLEKLDLRFNQISSIDPKDLEKLKNLKKLNLNFNPISDEVIKKLKAYYPNLEINADYIGAKYRDQGIAPYRIKGVRGRSSVE